MSTYAGLPFTEISTALRMLTTRTWKVLNLESLILVCFTKVY